MTKTKIKIALAAVLFAASSSAALASYYDPNLANRYPGYAEPNTYGYVGGANTPQKLNGAAASTLQSSEVRLQKYGNAYLQSAPVLQQRDVALPTGTAGSNDWFAIERSDRASSPYAGGN